MKQLLAPKRPETSAARGFSDRAAAGALCLGFLAFLAGCAPASTKLGEPTPAELTAAWSRVHTSVAGMPAVSPAHDSDGDGISDERERALRSDPNKRDTDDDGFDDGFEDMFSEFGFDLLARSLDSDQDGLEDGFELRIGSNPRDADSDGDGWGDFDEVINRHYGFDPLVRTADSDFDGLSDELELRIGSSPNNVDTNGDGINDFIAYSAGLNPAGPRIPGGLGELTGITYSNAMGEALQAIRAGGQFPEAIAGELPYPRVTQTLVTSKRVKPSAALMQRSAYNPRNSPGIYKSYNEIVNELFATAATFDGSTGPDLVRLFVWSQPTVDCCEAMEGREKHGLPIYAMKISANPGVNEKEPEVLFMGAHHGRELITATFTLDLINTLTKGYATGDPEIRRLVESAEIWVMPVVNPNGYERVLGNQLMWRKNTRKVSPVQKVIGVDINRNYGFEHATALTIPQRTALDSNARDSNGITSAGAFDIDNEQYPGTGPFTEVETQAVRGLAHSQFAGENRHQVDGLTCSLSWHTYSGTVGHPMAHTPMVPPNTGLTVADSATLGSLTHNVATAIGYRNILDTFEKQREANGDPIDGYPTFGDSDDWLYKDGHTYSILVEGYSAAEGMTNYAFYPTTIIGRESVSANNIKGAFAFIRSCPR